MKTCLYNFDPLKPHFYIVKLWFTGVYIIFLISAQNIECGYPLEPPHRGGSNEYPQSIFWAEIRKKSKFLSENFQFLVVKFSVYLNRHVFVMIIIFYYYYLKGNAKYVSEMKDLDKSWHKFGQNRIKSRRPKTFKSLNTIIKGFATLNTCTHRGS